MPVSVPPCTCASARALVQARAHVRVYARAHACVRARACVRACMPWVLCLSVGPCPSLTPLRPPHPPPVCMHACVCLRMPMGVGVWMWVALWLRGCEVVQLHGCEHLTLGGATRASVLATLIVHCASRKAEFMNQIGHRRRHVQYRGSRRAGTQNGRLGESSLTMRGNMPSKCPKACLYTDLLCTPRLGWRSLELRSFQSQWCAVRAERPHSCRIRWNIRWNNSRSDMTSASSIRQEEGPRGTAALRIRVSQQPQGAISPIH